MGLFDFFRKKKPAEDQTAPAKPSPAPLADAPLDDAPKVDAPNDEVVQDTVAKDTPAKPKSSKPKSSKKQPLKQKAAKKQSAKKAAPKPKTAEPKASVSATTPEDTQPAPEAEIAPPIDPEAKGQAEAQIATQADAQAEAKPAPQPAVEEMPAETAEPPKPAKKSWFSKLKDGLGKSATKITASLSIFGKPKLDASDLEDIEDALIMADLGVAAATRLAEGLKKRDYPNGVDQDSLSEALADEVATILSPVAKPLEINPQHKPHVILMVGVNGSGKTTTAGKLAEQWHQAGLKVTMAAADTFRAAAVEQLKIWGERTGTTVIAGEQGSDAAAVAYQAYEQAINEGADVLIVDTAGRLQAKTELMDELAKICRVIAKKDEAAPHDRVIVLDGTVGQNALSQVSAFKETAGLTGMIVTKLDGSARGGVVVALAQEFGLPIHAVGVGEGKDDLDAFDAVDFGRALAGLEAQPRQ